MLPEQIDQIGLPVLATAVISLLDHGELATLQVASGVGDEFVEILYNKQSFYLSRSSTV